MLQLQRRGCEVFHWFILRRGYTQKSLVDKDSTIIVEPRREIMLIILTKAPCFPYAKAVKGNQMVKDHACIYSHNRKTIQQSYHHHLLVCTPMPLQLHISPFDHTLASTKLL